MNLLLLVALSVAVKGVSFTPMEVERLPDLNIPPRTVFPICPF